MARKKPPTRIVIQRSRHNTNRRLCDAVPSLEARKDLSGLATYGAYSKHKFNPTAYRLTPYAGSDVERTYCDEHSHFGKDDFARIPALLLRGIMLGLWSEQTSNSTPDLLWTIDDTGWIFELRITNSGQSQYHGYPVLTGDAFARHVLNRAREVAFNSYQFPIDRDQNVRAAIAAAETFYR